MPIDDNKPVNNFWNPQQWQPLQNKTELTQFKLPWPIFGTNNQNFNLQQLSNTQPTFQELLKHFQNNKPEINQNFICEPDALRVASAVPFDIIEPAHEIKIDNPPIIPNCHKNYNKNFNVTKDLFNGSAEDLNRCLKGTKLAGMGQMFLDTQEKYGINAIFLMAIARGESGYGKKPQKNPFSIFGTGDRTSKSYKECLDKLGRNLKQNYITKNKLDTIGKINKRYAPTNIKWANNIANHMSIISKQIMKEYNI